MKSTLKTMMGTSVLLILVACGGGENAPLGSNFSTSNLIPVSGSDTIIGTWIGVADFTEVGVLYNEEATLKGHRMFTLQITADGIGGYKLKNCKNNYQSTAVSLSSSTGAVSLLGRDFLMTNFNQMTGATAKTEWVINGQGQENWNWVKVSNATDGIGSIASKYTPANSTTRSSTNDLSALCRESYTYTGSEEAWTTLADSAAYLSSGTKYFFAQEDSDGWGVIQVPERSISIGLEDGRANLNVISNSLSAYQANYSVTYSEFTFTGSLIQEIPQ